MSEITAIINAVQGAIVNLSKDGLLVHDSGSIYQRIKVWRCDMYSPEFDVVVEAIEQSGYRSWYEFYSDWATIYVERIITLSADEFFEQARNLLDIPPDPIVDYGDTDDDFPTPTVRPSRARRIPRS